MVIDSSAALVDLKLRNIMFEFSSVRTAEALTNPLLSHSSYHLSYEVFLVCSCYPKKQSTFGTCVIMTLSCNSAAYAIVPSVTRDNRHHSYVASNEPSWLSTMLAIEAASHYGCQ